MSEANAPVPATGIKRQTVWSVLPLVVISAVNIFSVPMFVRSLGDERFALWNYVALLTGMFGFTDLGLGVVVGRYVGVALGKGDQAAVRSYWGTGNSIVLPLVTVMTIVFTAVGVWFGPRWFQVAPGDEGLMRACFVAGGAGLFFNYYGQYWNILAQAHFDFKFIGILRTALMLIQVIPQVVLAYTTRNPLWVTLWASATALLGLLVYMWHARQKYQMGFHLSAASFSRVREMAAFAGKSFVGLVAASFFNGIDRVMLGRLALPVEFNPYTVSANLAGRLQGLSTAVMGPVFFHTSRVANDARSQAARIYEESFAFIFEWYLLAAIWVGLWHPVLLRLWLGEDMGAKASPLITPLIVACCINALANISGAQLGSLNRLGTVVAFIVLGGGLAVVGVSIGWNIAGAIGAAYGFLFSRIGFLAQDLVTCRLIGAKAWLRWRTWKQVAMQVAVALVFAPVYLVVPRDSNWLLAPAILHAGLVSAWLLRPQLQKMIAPLKTFQAL